MLIGEAIGDQICGNRIVFSRLQLASDVLNLHRRMRLLASSAIPSNCRSHGAVLLHEDHVEMVGSRRF
jgi:hypothetical protein